MFSLNHVALLGEPSDKLAWHMNAGDLIGPLPETQLYKWCKHGVTWEEGTHSCCQ